MKYRGIELIESKSSGLLSFRYDNKLYRGFWGLGEAKPKIDEIKSAERERHDRVVRNEKIMHKLLKSLGFGKSFEVEVDVSDFAYTGVKQKIETRELRQVRVSGNKILFSAVDGKK